MILTPQQFESLMQQHQKELLQLIENDLPVIIGKMAVSL